jgi:hypothetical protein
LCRERLGLGTIGPFLLALSGVVLIALALGLLGATLYRARRIGVLFLSVPVGVYGLSVLPAWVLRGRRVGSRRAASVSGMSPLERPCWRYGPRGARDRRDAARCARHGAARLQAAHRARQSGLAAAGARDSMSYVNGMESALVLLFYSLSVFLASKPESTESALHSVYLGFALAGLTLARLDHAFFVLALLLAYALICQRADARGEPKSGLRMRCVEFVRRLQLPALAGLVAAFCVVPYLLQNRYFFGNYVPLSGVAKSTFPHFTPENFDRLKGMLSGHPRLDDDWWIQIASRELQIVVPAIYCLVYLLIRVFRRSRAPLTTLLSASAVGASLLAAYNFSFTPPFDQGYWYMPVSTLLPTLFLLNARPFAIRGSSRVRSAITVALTGAVIAFFFCWQRHRLTIATFARPCCKTRARPAPTIRGACPRSSKSTTVWWGTRWTRQLIRAFWHSIRKASWSGNKATYSSFCWLAGSTESRLQPIARRAPAMKYWLRGSAPRWLRAFRISWCIESACLPTACC